jgi:hypothetical protein
MITADEYGYFAGRALDGMSAIVAGLGDDLANRRPRLRGANTPYALLTHCLGVIESWVGYLVSGRHAERDRLAEFQASGPTAPLLERAAAVRRQFLDDVARADYRAALWARPPADFEGPGRELTRGAALQHVYEELAQHHGQMELIRDLILAEAEGGSAGEPA